MGAGEEYAYEVLNFVDGKRNVGEIRDAVSTEYGPVVPIESCAEYLKALESIGVLKRVPAPSAQNSKRVRRCATILCPPFSGAQNKMTTGTMQALRKPRAERGAALENVPVPTIGPNDVLVRVRAASICGTDLHIYAWDPWSASRIKPPMTFGHEFCGVVEKVGSEVNPIMARPGEFVSAEMHVNCGHCRQCRMGQPHVCQNLKIIGIDENGCFAEFVSIPAANIWKMDPAIPEHYGAIMDPLGNAVHTVLSGPIAAQTVAVTGCGPIGLMAIAVAKACGASKIFATEVNAERRAMALRMGADVALDPSAGETLWRR